MKVQLRQGLYDVNALTFKLIEDNAATLRELGLYERALLNAFINTSHATFSLPDLLRLFETVDRARLRAAGDPIPGPGPFTLYRGVAAEEEEDRRVRGISWTRSIDQARSFARDHDSLAAEWGGLSDPGVYRVTIDEQHVLAYTNAKGEDEFIVVLPAAIIPERVE